MGRFDEPEESSIEREPLESKSRLTKLKAMFLKVTVWRCCAENKWRWDSCDKSQQKMYEQKLPQNKGGQTLQKVTQQVCHLVRVPLNVTGVASVSLLLYSSNWWWWTHEGTSYFLLSRKSVLFLSPQKTPDLCCILGLLFLSCARSVLKSTSRCHFLSPRWGPDEVQLLGLCSPGLSVGALAAPGTRCVTAESCCKHVLIYQTGEKESVSLPFWLAISP